jgi:hypothetical protein
MVPVLNFICGSPTEPAEVVVAVGAGHLVAAVELLEENVAFGTEGAADYFHILLVFREIRGQDILIWSRLGVINLVLFLLKPPVPPPLCLLFFSKFLLASALIFNLYASFATDNLTRGACSISFPEIF